MKRLVFLSISLLLILVPGCITFQIAPTVTTPPPGEPPVIIEFISTPSTIDPGSTSILLWNVTGADSINIDQGIGSMVDAAAGTVTVSPAASAIYTISATNSAGTVTSSLAVTVNPVSPTPVPQTISGEMTIKLPVINEESGSMVSSQPLGSSASYFKFNKNSLCIGDSGGSDQSKALLSFDISAIPQTAIIEEAILDLSDNIVTGNPTYAETFGGMGAMKVYHHQYGDIDDPMRVTMIWSNRLAKLTENGTFNDYPLSPWAWDVKNSQDGEPVIQGLVQAGQSRSQFMIEFFTSTDWDSDADMLCFSNVTLTVKYTVH